MISATAIILVVAGVVFVLAIVDYRVGFVYVATVAAAIALKLRLTTIKQWFRVRRNAMVDGIAIPLVLTVAAISSGYLIIGDSANSHVRNWLGIVRAPLVAIPDPSLVTSIVPTPSIAIANCFPILKLTLKATDDSLRSFKVVAIGTMQRKTVTFAFVSDAKQSGFGILEAAPGLIFRPPSCRYKNVTVVIKDLPKGSFYEARYAQPTVTPFLATESVRWAVDDAAEIDFLLIAKPYYRFRVLLNPLLGLANFSSLVLTTLAIILAFMFSTVIGPALKDVVARQLKTWFDARGSKNVPPVQPTKNE